MQDRAAPHGAASVGADVGKQIAQHVRHYAENPRAHAQALRKLGVSPAKVREVHRTMMPTHQQRLAPLTKHVKPLSRDEQLQIGVDNALRQNHIHAAGTPLDAVGRALNPTLTGIGKAGLYAAPALGITAKNIATGAYHDAGSTLHGKPTLKRTGHAAKPLVPDVRRDIKAAKHGDFSGVILDTVALASAGAGGAARVGAAGRALSAGEGVGRALTRKGYEGGSLLHAPEPGTVKLRAGDVTVEKPLSRNAALRQVQKARFARKQHELDAAQGQLREKATSGPGKIMEKHASAENTVGNRLRVERRLDQAHAKGDLEYMRRSVRKLSRKERRSAYAAMRVVGISGNEALKNPAGVIGRHIAAHEKWIAEGGDKVSHQGAIRDLHLAQKVLADNPERFHTALNAVRDLANHGEQESIARGFLSKEGAVARKLAIARDFGHTGDTAPEGAFYFHTGNARAVNQPGRVFNSRPGKYGMRPAEPGRYDSGLTHRYTGKGIRRGYIPINIPKAVEQTFSRRLVLHSRHDVYETLKGASTETRESRHQIPLPTNKKLSGAFRKYLQAAEENIHASPDELQRLTHDAAEQLKQEMEAKHLAHEPLGAKIKDVRWVDQRFLKDLGETSLRGNVEKVFDAFNNPIRAATLYLRPAYLLNALGNATMLAPEGPGAAHALWLAAKSEAHHGPRVTAYRDAAMGGGRALGQTVNTGFLHKAPEHLAEFWNNITDLHMRRAAQILEERRAGFKTRVDLERLYSDPKLASKLREITERGRVILGDYDNLTPVERNTLRRIVYFYPWLKVATTWTGHMLGEHPIISAVAASNGRVEADHVKRVMGLMPQWARLSGIIPVGKKHGDIIDTINPSSINTPSSVVQTAADAVGATRALIGLKSKGTAGLGDLATPFLHSVITAGGQTEGSQRTGLIGETLATPLPSALRRAGVLENIVGKPSKTYPLTDTSTEGRIKAGGLPLLGGGLTPRPTSVGALNRSGEKELRASRSPQANVAASFADFRKQAKTILKQHGVKMPREYAARLNLWQERQSARAQAHDNTWESHIAADLKVIHAHGWIDNQQYAMAVRNLKSAPKDTATRAGISRQLTNSYFDRGGILHKGAKEMGLKLPQH